MQYDWIDFYTEFATKLLPFKTDRKTLIQKMYAVYDTVGISVPKLESGDEIIDIDPFTIFGTFNKGINWNVQYNRNNQTYRMLISICYLVVKGLLQTQSNGHTKLMDFLDEQRIYATALDYDRTAKTTKQFFAKVQNKMHYAVHGHTAAELIYERADADKPHMGLTTWAGAPEGKIVKSDVSVAKNYLSEQEMRSLERIVSAYLDLAEDRAERHIPMTMEDWAKRLDLFLMADDREVLQDAGKITAEIAKAKAETEFEKYRVIQDRLFMSDFDKYMLELEENAKK